MAAVSSGGGVEEAFVDSKLRPNAPPPGLFGRLFPLFPWHVLPNYLTYARCLSIPALYVVIWRWGTQWGVCMSSLMEYATFGILFGGELLRKIQSLEQHGTLHAKLNNQTHTATNIEQQIELGALGYLLEQQTETTAGLQLMIIIWGMCSTTPKQG